MFVELHYVSLGVQREMFCRDLELVKFRVRGEETESSFNVYSGDFPVFVVFLVGKFSDPQEFVQGHLVVHGQLGEGLQSRFLDSQFDV